MLGHTIGKRTSGDATIFIKYRTGVYFAPNLKEANRPMLYEITANSKVGFQSLRGAHIVEHALWALLDVEE